MKSKHSLITILILSIAHTFLSSKSSINFKNSSSNDFKVENTIYPSYTCNLKVLKMSFDERIDISQKGILVYKTYISIHIVKTSNINVFPIKYDMELTWNIIDERKDKKNSDDKDNKGNTNNDDADNVLPTDDMDE